MLRVIETSREGARGKTHVSLRKYGHKSLFTQLKVLARRDALNSLRDKKSLIARMVVNVVISTIVGCVFLGVGNLAPYVQQGKLLPDPSHQGGVSLMGTNAMFGVAQSVLLTFPIERPAFLREYVAGFYGVVPYVIAKTFTEVVITAVQLAIQVMILSLFMALDGPYFFMFLTAYLLAVATSSSAFAVVGYMREVKRAAEVFPLLLGPQLLFAGVFMPSSQIPVFLRWIQYICPLKYGIADLYKYEFYGNVPGDNLLDKNGIDPSLDWLFLLVLMFLTIAFRTVSTLGLKRNAKTVF